MLTVLAGVALYAQGEEMRLMRYPDIHGDDVVFTYAADLWTADRKGGLARRLTSHPGGEIRARFSPDGRWIAFTGEYDGNPDVYVIPSEGGEPRRLTFEPEADLILDWTPEGKIAYKSTYGSFTNRQPRLWIVDPNGGIPKRTAVEEIQDASFSPDGRQIAYNRVNSHQYNWRRYRGGTQGKISVFHLGHQSYYELPHKRENSWLPMWVADSIYYVSDRNQGTVNLYRHDLKDRRDVQLTRFADADIKWPQTDGKNIVFERDGYLFAYDIATAATEKLSPKVLSDNVAARPALRRLGTQIVDLDISPTGARVIVEARGDLFSLPARNGETRNLTATTGSRERWPRWSPDGKSIAYACDVAGNYEVYLEPQLGGPVEQLTTNSGLAISGLSWAPTGEFLLVSTESNELWMLDAKSKKLSKVFKARFGLSGYDVSADGKWIAYVDQQPNQFGGTYMYEVATGKAAQVTEGYYDDSSVAFDLSGKYLYLVSARTFSPTFGLYEFSLKVENAHRLYVIPLSKDTLNPLAPPVDEEPDAKPAGGSPSPAPPPPPMKVDLEGMADRAVVLPMSATSIFYAFGGRDSVYYVTPQGLFVFGFATRQPQLIGTGTGAFAVNPSRTKIAYYSGGTLGITDLRPGIEVGQGRVDSGAIEAVVDPAQEWRQMFWEAWRYMRDNFYDPNLLGIDWKAVGLRYEKYLTHVKHRADLNYVFGLMIGELGTGHSYVQGGDMGPMPPPVPVGMLGVDYDVEGAHVRLKKVYRGTNYEESSRGPLGEPGLNVADGDYLLEIDGNPLRSGVNPSSLLVGKAGRTVVLTINSTPSDTGSRKIRVRPIASESGLRYRDYVEATRKKVSQLSGGKIGYMHIPDTAFSGAIELIRGFYSQTDKEAVIVDERWNGGGFVQPWFVDTLARKVRAGVQNRNAADSSDAVAFEGPMCMLINYHAGSGGDFFPWMFRQSKLGPLIGTRTWGGLVGISGFAPLVDGGGISAPEFGIYDKSTGEWIAENQGVSPDVEVDLRPDLVAQGRDPQLEAALDYLTKRLKDPKRPWKKPNFGKINPD